MSVFFRPKGSNNVFHFFEDNEAKNEIKTISYQLDSDGKILGKWEQKGSVKQLMGAIKSFEIGQTEIISKENMEKILDKKKTNIPK